MTDTRKGEGATSLDWAMLRAANLGLSLGENLSKVAEQFRMIEAETEAKSATRIEALEAALKDGEKHFLAALEARGMVVVPREPSDLQDQAGHDAYHWYNKMMGQRQVTRHNVWQTIYRAMTEAYNG